MVLHVQHEILDLVWEPRLDRERLLLVPDADSSKARHKYVCEFCCFGFQRLECIQVCAHVGDAEILEGFERFGRDEGAEVEPWEDLLALATHFVSDWQMRFMRIWRREETLASTLCRWALG